MLSNTIALGIAFCVMLLISPKGIAILHQLKFGQEVRDDGPQAHLKKQGTPTMGGILFLIAISVAVLPFIKEKGVLPAYLLGLGFGIVGFIDDYLKVVKHQSEGFNPKQKMAAQIIISLLYIAYLYFYSGHTTAFLFPFLKDTEVTFGILFFPISLFIITATDTGANFTDGIDGLCFSLWRIEFCSGMYSWGHYPERYSEDFSDSSVLMHTPLRSLWEIRVPLHWAVLWWLWRFRQRRPCIFRSLPSSILWKYFP